MNNLDWFSKCNKWGKSYISISIAVYTYSHWSKRSTNSNKNNNGSLWDVNTVELFNFSHHKFSMFAMERLWVSVYFRMIFKLKVRQNWKIKGERVLFFNCFIRFFLQSWVSLPCLWHSWDQLVPEARREIAQVSCLSNCGPIISQGTSVLTYKMRVLVELIVPSSLHMCFRVFIRKLAGLLPDNCLRLFSIN